MKKNLLILFVFLMQIVNAQTPIYKWEFNSSLSNSGSTTVTSWVPTSGTATYTQDRFGQANNAINIPNTQAFTINGIMPSGNSARTLSFWVRFINDNDARNYMVAGWGNAANNEAFGFWRNGVQQTWYTWGSGNSYTLPETNSGIQALNNGWVHIAMTYNGSVIRTYYNGSNINNITRVLNTGNQNLILGRLVNNSTGTGDAFHLDDLRIYDTELSATQISDIYNQTTTSAPTISNVSATNVGSTTTTINYTVNANNAATNTEVRYAVSPGGTLVTLAGPNATGTSNTNLSLNLTGLAPNTTYEYNIRAVNIQGSTFSTPLFFTTGAAISVPTITNVSSSFISTNSATINYSIDFGGANATPVIKYGTASNNLNFTQLGDTVDGSSSTSQNVGLNGLLPNTTYFYRVEASNSAGNAVPSNILSFTTLPITQAPAITNVSTSNVSFNSATVNFNLNAFGSATNYVVEYSTDIIGNYTPVTPGGTTAANTSTPFTVQISGLNSSTQYFVRVRATNAANQVTTSNEVSFTTLNSINLTNLGVSNVTATTAQINYTLNTNGTNAFIEIRYQASTVFDSDSPFTTEVISNFTTVNNAPTNYNYSLTGLIPNTTYSYQFGAVNQINGGVETGENAAFTTLGVSVQPTAPSPQTFCQSSNPTVANLSATGTNIKWYANATGGSPLVNTTPLVSGTYYVTQTQTNSAESGRLAVTVTVNVTTAPTAQAQSFCNSATVANLTATGTNLKWYAAQTGGSQLANSTALATGNYFVSQTVNGCESARTAVAVTINVTAAPTASAQSFCNSATVANLVATGTGTIAWFNVATGGTALSSTTALATGTYFVQQTIGSCTSTRTAVAVTINVTTAPTASAQSFCNSATVANLVATGSALKWYANASGGTQLANTTALATGNYFVSQTINGCESARTAVAVTINVATAPTAQAQSFCNSATVANIVATGTNLKWYAAQTGGTQLAPTTALATGTYYVSQTVGTCESTRTAVAVTIGSAAAPTAVAQSFCNSATVANLTATGTNLKWYANASGGTQLANTTALATGNYFVSQTIGTCESTRTSVSVTVNVVNAPVAQAQSFCNSATIGQLTATGSNLKWYANASGGTQLANTTALATGNYFVSQTIGSCESTRTSVLVNVNAVTAPTGAATQSFVPGSTVSQIVTSGSNVTWFISAFNATNNINPLAANTVVTNGATYYAIQTVNGCRSTTPLAVTVTVTLSNIDVNKLVFSMYPNPAKDRLTIEMETELQSVEIYTLQGQIVQTSTNKNVFLNNLPTGVYIIKVEDVEGLFNTKKLIIK